MDMVQLSTSYSQHLKPLGTGRCEWLWTIVPCPNEPLPNCCTNGEL